VAEALAGHFAAGRLGIAEFRARLDAAYAATSPAELARLTSDLPPMAAPGRAPAWPGTGAPGAVARIGGIVRRVLLVLALMTLAIAAALTLVALLAPHGVLLAILLGVLVLPALAVAALTGAAFWVGRWAWRRGAWLEAVPLAAGMPWLGRLAWAARAALAGRALWRVAARRGYRHYGGQASGAYPGQMA
jgi:uncharacterized protein DUF1707